jgi:hypothetical protein
VSGSLRNVVFAATPLVAAVALTGCGGSKDAATTTTAAAPPSAEATAWAHGLCGALTTWNSTIRTAGKTVNARSTEAEMSEAMAVGQTATTTLKATLQGLGKPPGGSPEAQQEVQQLKGQLQSDIYVIGRAIKATDEPSQIEQTRTTVQDVVATIHHQVAEAGDKLRALPESDLSRALQATPSCVALKASRTA